MKVFSGLGAHRLVLPPSEKRGWIKTERVL
jgi:hypothetical protein